jgi:ferredoxin-NADP reductase
VTVILVISIAVGLFMCGLESNRGVLALSCGIGMGPYLLYKHLKSQ